MQLVNTFKKFCYKDGEKNKPILTSCKNFTTFFSHLTKKYQNFCKHVKNFTLNFAPCKNFYNISDTLVQKIKEILAN